MVRLAAVQGHALAQSNLGLMYAQGLGTPQDFVRAHMWFSLGAKAGDANATRNLNMTSVRLTPQQVTEAAKMADECQRRNFVGCD